MRALKKVIVIGCPGSGKTTFAKKLCESTGLPLYHLDAIWHLPDKTHISRDEFDIRLSEILARECWVVDGNYSRTMERRLQACDTVFLFDLPVRECICGAEARVGVVRPDMPWVESALDDGFRRQIKEFAANALPNIYDLIDKYADEKRIVIFKSREAADNFILQQN